jgi:hypothetical protein
MKIADNRKTIAGRISTTCNEHVQHIIVKLLLYPYTALL